MLLQTVLVLLCSSQVSASVRGIDPTKASNYQGNQFHCTDGSQSFPIGYVNDDYCDCKDGSDEPGTAACPNGNFYCNNKGFKGTLISSSRVDDGICDCCDGSDELGGSCTNNCVELGAHLLQEARRIRKEQAMGYQQRLGYAADGKAAKLRRDEDISVLAEEEAKHKKEMEERKSYKDEAEKPAKEAKEAAKAAHDKLEEEKKTVDDEQNRLDAELEYSNIDRDGDGEVTVDELLSYGSSEDSLLPYEEVKVMADNGEVEPATLLDMIQDQIRMRNEESVREEEKLKRDKQRRAKKPKLSDVSPPVDEDEEEVWGEDGKKIERHVEEDEDDYDEVDEDEKDEEEEEEPSPIRNTFTYDTETQQLIDVYEEAEDLYKEAKSQHDNAKNQLADLQKLNDKDFGDDEEFFVLHGQCFEYKDDKYKYKLCPYDKSDQDGTNIGKWEGWENDSDGVNRYNVMKYTKGNSCWQGPSRSTAVKVVCGSENAIIEASEPAKCEYAYTFTTPAKCTEVQDEWEIHDEL